MNRRTACKALAVAGLPTGTFARSCPLETGDCMTLIVPHAAGGFGDRLARLLAKQWFAKGMGKVLVLNKPGGGGSLALREFALAPGDGSVAFIGSTGTSVVLPLVKAGRGIPAPQPVIQLASIPGVLFASPNLPAGLESIVALAREKPGDLTFASAGIGSLGHLAVEALNDLWNVQIQHVPYKSGPEASPDLASGRVSFGILNISEGMRLLSAAPLQALAVSGPTRQAALPEVPTFVEAGIGAANIENWLGVFLPPTARQAELERLAVIFQEHRQAPEFGQQLKLQGAIPATSTMADFKTTLSDQARLISGLVTTRAIVLE